MPRRFGVRRALIAAGSAAVDPYGPELITNGGFDTDTDWLKSDAAWTISGGKAHCDGSQAGNADIYQDIDASIEDGKTYKFDFTVSNYSAGALTPLLDGVAESNIFANGVYSLEIVHSEAAGTKTGFRGNSLLACSIDDVSIKEVL